MEIMSWQDRPVTATALWIAVSTLVTGIITATMQDLGWAVIIAASCYGLYWLVRRIRATRKGYVGQITRATLHIAMAIIIIILSIIFLL